MSKVKGVEIIELYGNTYQLPHPNIFRDYITGGYLDNSIDGSRIVTDISLAKKYTRVRKLFDPKDSTSFNIYILEKDWTSAVNFENNTRDFPTLELNLHSVGRNSFTIYTKDPEKIIKKHNLVQGINNPEIYYDSREISYMDKPKPYRKFDNTYKKQTVKDLVKADVGKNEADLCELTKNITKRNIQMGVDSPTHQILEGKKYTLGIELETCRGRLEEEDVVNLNVKAVHDGSLRDAEGNTPGGEYVTGVLYGDAGFNQMHELCRVLSNKCEINNQCGVHVHIGSLNWNREDVVFSWLLAELLEEDLFSMLPKSRRSNDYCRALPKIITPKLKWLQTAPNSLEYKMKIEELYGLIHAEVAGTRDLDGPNSRVNKNTQHPKGAKCGYDKTAQRYCWLNYVTLLFDTKGVPNSHTLEFRPMSATLNYKKVRNWVKICVAFVYFVENFKNIIKDNKYTHTDGTVFKLDLELIVAKSYPKTGGNLIDYIRERKETFKTKTEAIDYKDVVADKKTIKEVICAL